MIPYVNHDTSLANLRSHLAEYGVAVIPNALRGPQIANMREGMWGLLESASVDFDRPIRRDDQDSWRSFYQLMPKHSMLIQNFCLAHAQYIWDLRQQQNLVDIFAHIWKCSGEDLVTSFDGFSVHFPPEVTNKGWHNGKDWLHVDQSFTRNGFECIQGFVTAWDIDEGDASLLFLEKSHQRHKQFREHFQVTEQSDWYRFKAKELEFYRRNGHAQKAIACRAGSLVLWDSRLVHAGTKAFKQRKHAKIRHVVYLCQIPRVRCTSKMLSKRIAAFEARRTTNHWPDKVKLFPVTPKMYGNSVPRVTIPPAPVLSALGRRLVGYA